MNLSDAQRLNGWLTAVRVLRAHPSRWLFGWGPETFRALYRLHRTQHAADMIGGMRVADHVHNLPLELLVTLGVVGTAAFVYFVRVLWREAGPDARAAMLGLGVLSLVELVFFPAAALLFLALGADRSCRLQTWSYDTVRFARAAAMGLALASAGVWADDVFNPRRSLLLHPHESEANQQAVMEALWADQPAHAIFYARRAAAADPRYRELAAQAAALEVAVRERPLR